MALALLLIYNNATGQIWGSEPFADADGTKTGAGGIWTTDASACNLIDGGKFEVEAASGKIVGEDTDGVAVWKTQTIDISGNDQVRSFHWILTMTETAPVPMMKYRFIILLMVVVKS